MVIVSHVYKSNSRTYATMLIKLVSTTILCCLAEAAPQLALQGTTKLPCSCLLYKAESRLSNVIQNGEP